MIRIGEGPVRLSVHHGNLYAISDIGERFVIKEPEFISSYIDDDPRRKRAIELSKQQELKDEFGRKLLPFVGDTFETPDNRVILSTHGYIRIFDGEKLEDIRIPKTWAESDDEAPMDAYVRKISPFDSKRVIITGGYTSLNNPTLIPEFGRYKRKDERKHAIAMILDLETKKFTPLPLDDSMMFAPVGASNGKLAAVFAYGQDKSGIFLYDCQAKTVKKYDFKSLGDTPMVYSMQLAEINGKTSVVYTDDKGVKVMGVDTEDYISFNVCARGQVAVRNGIIYASNFRGDVFKLIP